MSAPFEASVNTFEWDRVSVPPSPPDLTPHSECLYCRGQLLRRSELARELGLSPAATDIAAILVAAYERWGDELCGRLSGWCSFVLWDPRRDRLLVVADPRGHQPLFYSWSNRGVVISPQAESLAPRAIDRLDLDSVAAHVCGFSPRLGQSYFRGVLSVPPASMLVIERDASRLRSIGGSRRSRPRSREDAADELRATLEAAVVDHTEDAETVGVTLSSGLDSTSVAAALATVRSSTRRIAFVWSAPTVPEADESVVATRLAHSLGMEVVEVRADLHAPLSDSSSLVPRAASPLCNIYREIWRETFRQAREHGVRVLLTGQGGDLGFGGVFPFADLFLKGRWRRLCQEVAAYRGRVEVDFPWLLRYRVFGQAARWFWPRSTVAPPRWFGPALRGHLPREPLHGRMALPGRRERRRLLLNPRRFAGTASLTEDAADFGIEVRHPWVDPRLVALAESLPSDWIFSDGLHKAPIRNGLRGLLPPEIVDRAEKIYPDPIFRRALRGPDRVKIERLLDDMVAARLGFVEPRELRVAIDEYSKGRGSGVFWHSLSLEAWLRGFPSVAVE